MSTATSPRWSPVDDDTHDLLTAVAEPHPIVGADAQEICLAACRADALAHDGMVSVNRVRELMAEKDIPARRYSALWAHCTGRGKPMVKALDDQGHNIWEECEGSTSGNDGRPFPLRRWVSEAGR